MALKLIGDSGYEVDTNADKAIFAEERPPAMGGLGAYVISANTGAIAATLASGASVLQFAWQSPTNYCLLRRVAVSGVVTGTITPPAVPFNLGLYVARAITGLGSGGTALNIFSPDNQKLDRRFPASMVADLRVSSTAALGAGASSIDTNPLGWANGWTGTAVATRLFKDRGNVPIFDRTEYGQHPLVLAKNEGFGIGSSVAGPATGTFNLTFLIEWQEVPAY